MRYDGAKTVFGARDLPWHGAKLELPHKFSLNVGHAPPKRQGAVLLRGDHL